MNNLKEQYEKIISERKELITQINELANDEKVKKYFELCSKNNQLADQQKELYKQIRIKEFSSCNHIWVTTLHDYDRLEGRTYNYCGCMKCGLDQRVFYLMENRNELDYLTQEEQIMYNFMYGAYYKSGIDTKILCDLDLAKAIYAKIKDAHPDIDDKTARKYFEIALDNIRKKKANDERKANRIKRLSLNRKFNKWTVSDVCSH